MFIDNGLNNAVDVPILLVISSTFNALSIGIGPVVAAAVLFMKRDYFYRLIDTPQTHNTLYALLGHPSIQTNNLLIG